MNKNLNKMSVEEFNSLVSKTMDSFRDNTVYTTTPKTFIIGGRIFNKDTPKKDWEWLDKEMGQ
jgi:hypothetical protein